jgi:soluble lytic murein transglycosylase-like protein
MSTTLAAVAANCWLTAASAFDLPPGLLYAMAQVESAMNPRALAHAPNGTVSMGVMQINSSWGETLRGMGIELRDLQDPCANIRVGSWILAQGVRRYGYSWEAIGAYYAGPFDAPGQRWRLKHYHGYANRVLAAWRKLMLTSRSPEHQ